MPLLEDTTNETNFNMLEVNMSLALVGMLLSTGFAQTRRNYVPVDLQWRVDLGTTMVHLILMACLTEPHIGYLVTMGEEHTVVVLRVMVDADGPNSVLGESTRLIEQLFGQHSKSSAILSDVSVMEDLFVSHAERFGIDSIARVGW